jgi:hypothetical protein
MERRLIIHTLRGASLAAEGNELAYPWIHGVVRHGVGCNGVVAETYTHVTLRVELETGELLVWANLVDGGGVGLQVHRVYVKHDTPRD